jgi:outer membrane protein TolC
LSNQSFYLPDRTESLTLALSAGARLQWTIFDTLTTFNAVRDASYVHARLALDRTRLGFAVAAQVREAHSHVLYALERQPIADHAVMTAKSDLEMMRKRYDVGQAIFIELTEAETDLLQSESDQIDAWINLAEAEAALEAAMGRL